MTKERTIELLEDIKPTKLRLRQAEYTLTLAGEIQPLRAVSYGDKVSTYKVGDTTADTFIQSEDRKISARGEVVELKAKLELYNQWLKSLEEESRKLIKAIYEEGHSMEWLAIDQGYEATTIRTRKHRIVSKLSEVDIVAMTEAEKGRTRND